MPHTTRPALACTLALLAGTSAAHAQRQSAAAITDPNDPKFLTAQTRKMGGIMPPEELALRLQLRLQRLGAMREAGARLLARDRIGRDVFLRGAAEGLRVDRKNLWQCEWFDLVAAYGQVKARTEPVVHLVRDRMVMTLDSALERVSAMLGVRLEWMELRDFLPSHADPRLQRSALASSFVAALELARLGKAELRQEETFGPLHLRQAAA